MVVCCMNIEDKDNARKRTVPSGLLEFESYTDVRRVVARMHEHLAILDALAADEQLLASQCPHQHSIRAAAAADGKPP